MTLSHPPLAPSILFDMLGGRTMKQFAMLDEEDRRDIFCQHLVADESIEVREYMDLDKLNATHSFLVFRKEFGNSKLGQQLTQEARRVFYEENDFFVWLDDLDDFLDDILPGEGRIDAAPVASLVRNIAVLVERHQCRCGNLTDFFQQARIFSNLDSITYEWRDCWERYDRHELE
jgi:hypothetical protein